MSHFELPFCSLPLGLQGPALISFIHSSVSMGLSFIVILFSMSTSPNLPPCTSTAPVALGAVTIVVMIAVLAIIEIAACPPPLLLPPDAGDLLPLLGELFLPGEFLLDDGGVAFAPLGSFGS